jgi:hypothetical protein
MADRSEDANAVFAAAQARGREAEFLGITDEMIALYAPCKEIRAGVPREEHEIVHTNRHCYNCPFKKLNSLLHRRPRNSSIFGIKLGDRRPPPPDCNPVEEEDWTSTRMLRLEAALQAKRQGKP